MTYAHAERVSYPTETDPVYPVPLHDPRLIAWQCNLADDLDLNPDMAGAVVTLWVLPGSYYIGSSHGYTTQKFFCWYRVHKLGHQPDPWHFTVQTVTHGLPKIHQERDRIDPWHVSYAVIDLLSTRLVPMVAPVTRLNSEGRRFNYTGRQSTYCATRPLYIHDYMIFSAGMVAGPSMPSPLGHWSLCRQAAQRQISDAWVIREDARPVHPAIDMLLTQGHRPVSMSALAMQYPHIPQDGDLGRVAYTRSVEHGVQDRQTVTSLAKYLRQHFTMTDHELRDFVAGVMAQGKCQVLTDIDDMIDALENGPGSCMTGEDFRIHPYNVYDPSLGWGLAIRGTIDDPKGRALVFDGKTVGGKPVKCFVRTYGNLVSADKTQADSMLAGWLQMQGYEYVHGWPCGTPIRAIQLGDYGKYVMPYIDGDTDQVRLEDGVMVIGDEGVSATETSGYIDMTPSIECDHCGEYADEDDTYSAVDRTGDEITICHHCSYHNFISAWVDRHEQMQAPANECTQATDGDYVLDYALNNGDTDYVRLDDGSVAPVDDTVTLRDGSTAHIDDAVQAWDETWIHEDDAVVLDDGPYKGEYAHEADECVEDYDGCVVLASACVVCSVSGDYVLRGEAVRVGGKWYHPDEVPEDDEPDDTDSEELVINDAQQALAPVQTAQA